MKASLDANQQTARSLDATAEALDCVLYAKCRIPPFSAMQATPSFASCFRQAPIAAGSMAPDSEGCGPELGTELLPCFDEAAGYAPIHCRTDELAALRNSDWVTPLVT